ncbi:MAG: superfamily protein [Actinomycetia bacterium]|nr:superfamily protein [Actinomycetes bacterium]
MQRGNDHGRGRFVQRSDALVAVFGVAVLLLGMLAVRHGSVSALERSAFRRVNDLPGALYPALWPFQQLGVIVVGPIAAAIAAFFRRFRLAAALLVATVAKLGLERVVKKFVSRQRPGASIGGHIHLRGNVSAHGESFVSGHAVLVAAVACLIVPYLRGRWKIVPWAIVGTVMVTRVYVGAHNPLDVICGTALGLAIGSCLNLAFGVPAADRE